MIDEDVRRAAMKLEKACITLLAVDKEARVLWEADEALLERTLQLARHVATKAVR